MAKNTMRFLPYFVICRIRELAWILCQDGISTRVLDDVSNLNTEVAMETKIILLPNENVAIDVSGVKMITSPFLLMKELEL